MMTCRSSHVAVLAGNWRHLISTWGIAELPFFTSRRSRITPGFIDDELRSSIKKINLCWYQEVGGRAVRSGTCDWDNTSHKSTFSAPLAFSISVAWFRRQDPVLPRKMRSVRWDPKQLALALPCGGSRSIWYSGNGGFHHSMGLISLGPASGGFRTASAASGGAVAGAPVHLAFSLVHCLRRFALHLAQ